MSIQAIVAIAAIVISIIGAIITHICVSVWWASKITTTLGFIEKAVEKMERHQDTYYLKEDAIKELATATVQRDGMWKRIDESKKQIDVMQREIDFLKNILDKEIK